MNDTIKKTPLYDVHLGLGAKMVPFAEYEMPVQYPTGIRMEHQAVRAAAGLFDVSHMGEFLIHGPQALDLVQLVAVNDAASLATGQCQYSAMCAEDGGVRDDIVVYHMADHYMLVVNASRRAQDWAWLVEHAEGLEVTLEDGSDGIGLLALQGPCAQEILDPLVDVGLDDIAYYNFAEGTVAGCPATISRTGYTGEDGFELYVAEEDTVAVWNAVLEQGEAIAEYLARVAGIGEAVDHRNAGVVREVDERLVRVRASHDEVHPALQVASDVRHGFPLAQLNVRRAQVDSGPSQLAHADVERDTCA